MGSFSEELALQARLLADQIQDGSELRPDWEETESYDVKEWSAAETRELLSCTGERWQHHASSLLNRDVEACVWRMESLLMGVKTPDRPASTPSKKWMNARLLPRLTERQQLALLLNPKSCELAEDTHDDRRDPWPEEFEQWASSKQILWQQIDSAPEKFYYEHVPPGVAPKSEAWTLEEEQLFLLKLKQHPPLGFWGLFSMHIPGRTGMQCEQYYRTLEAEGKVDKGAEKSIPVDLSSSHRKPQTHHDPKSPGKTKRKRLSSFAPECVASPKETIQPRSVFTPDNPTTVAFPSAPNDIRTSKQRSKPGSSMAPVSLLHLEGSGKVAKRLDMDRAIGGPKSEEELEAEEEAREEAWRRRMWQLREGGAPSRAPFSSASLPPLSSPPEFGAELEDEMFVIDRVLQFRKARLQEALGNQLEQLRPCEDTPFTVLEGCKWLRKAHPDRDAQVSIFELPSTREQRIRRCMEEGQQAQKDAERMYQFQVQALEALQCHNLAH